MTWGQRDHYMVRHVALQRSRFKAKPPEPGSARDLRDQLDSLNAQIVKPRDGHWCVQCRADNVPNQGILDAGHLYPKGKFPGGRFLLENIFCQCRFHNTLHIGSPTVFMTWYQQRYGEDALQALHAKVLAPAPSLEDMQTLLIEREKTLAEMRVHMSAMV